AGPVRVRGAAGLGRDRPPLVVIGPSHDTAAALAAVPAADDAFAFVCTGTWALAGLELAAPVITGASQQAGFSNEAGIDGTTRFLRNVTGFWLLQECVRQWQSDGQHVDLDELTRAAARRPGQRALIDVQDPGFAASGQMTQRITRACLRTSG
ncbi:MAG: FGGY-family carbohydrate kinase, partial [Actinomycetota bacterium]|nr:FGGY-family carbohydrate kinase [Actinomycetota bacterium]